MEKAVLKNLEVVAYDASRVDLFETSFGKGQGEKMIVTGNFISDMIYALKNFIESAEEDSFDNEKYREALMRYIEETVANSIAFCNDVKRLEGR